MANGNLPTYSQPPVVETVVGVQFEPLPALTSAHLGAFWQGLGKEWRHVVDAPPLEPQFERFDDDRSWDRPGIRLMLAHVQSIRLQICNADGDRMIQVQNGRLHFNWLGHRGGAYPRYHAVRKGFDETLAQFKDFLSAHGLGELQPNQWEVTYVNQIPKGTVWRSPEDWQFFRLLQSVPAVGSGAQLESFGGEWHFEISPQRGRLHVKWQHGRQSEPNEQEVLVLMLTARGPFLQDGDSAREIGDGLDLGHRTIVQTFSNLMSDQANSYWGLKHGND